MKKLLYIAFNNRENTLYGVRAKILSQCRAFSEWGYRVDLIERRGPETVVMMENGETVTVKERKAGIHNYYVRSVLDKQYQMLDIKAHVKDKKYDACYIRYDFSDLGFISLLKKLKATCGKIVNSSNTRRSILTYLPTVWNFPLFFVSPSKSRLYKTAKG